MGSAALFHLARRGAAVLGIEQFGIAHERGASHGESRIIRKAYFEHADYVPLLERAYELWRELQGGSRARLFDEGVGLLLAGPPDGQVIAPTMESARRHGLAVRRLGREEAAERHPALRVPEDCEALWDPDGGILRPESCVKEHVDSAR